MLTLTHYVTELINGSFDETLAIAVFHTLFSVLGACIFVPLIKPFAAFIMRIVPEKENRLTKHLDDSITNMPAIALQVGFDTLQQLLKELTQVVMLLIREKRSTDAYEKRVVEVEIALEETRRFLAMIQSSNVRDREKHLNLMHVTDHLARLIKVLRDQQHAEAVYLQNETMENFNGVLERVMERIDHKEAFIRTATLLENTSKEMADRRRAKREEYFERAITNEVDVEQSTAKVEAILWVDRLIFHFFRSSARMANYVRLDEMRQMK